MLTTFKPKDFIEWLVSQSLTDPEVALESDSEDITLPCDIAKDYRTTKRNLGRHGVSDFDDLLEKAYFMLVIMKVLERGSRLGGDTCLLTNIKIRTRSNFAFLNYCVASHSTLHGGG